MKLTEIFKLPRQTQSGLHPKVIQMVDAVLIGTVENIPLYKSEYGNNEEAYALKKDGKFVCWLYGVVGHIVSKPVLYVQRTFVLPEYRNKGLVTALYQNLNSKFDKTIVSDNEQSPETISVWNKLSKISTVCVLDIDTMKKVNKKDVPDKMLYGSERYRLMLEAYENSEFAVIPKRGSGIIGDYEMFTHPENMGLYE